jgi:hypothetical protein
MISVDKYWVVAIIDAAIINAGNISIWKVDSNFIIIIVIKILINFMFSDYLISYLVTII